LSAKPSDPTTTHPLSQSAAERNGWNDAAEPFEAAADGNILSCAALKYRGLADIGGKRDRFGRHIFTSRRRSAQNACIRQLAHCRRRCAHDFRANFTNSSALCHWFFKVDD
jgi:hypothetical protein